MCSEHLETCFGHFSCLSCLVSLLKCKMSPNPPTLGLGPAPAPRCCPGVSQAGCWGGSVPRACAGSPLSAVPWQGSPGLSCSPGLPAGILAWLSLGAAPGPAWALLLIVGALLCFHLCLCCQWLLFLSQTRAGNSQLFWPLCQRQSPSPFSWLQFGPTGYEARGWFIF